MKTVIATACALAAAGPLCAQPLWESFDQYSASPTGEPLAGQGAWTVPSGAEPGWRVYPHEGNPFDLPRPFSSLRLAAGIGDGAAAAAEHPLTPDSRGYVNLEARVAVRFTGRPPASGEIGRMTLEPLGDSASAALIARWDDTTGERWSIWLLWYDTTGREQFSEVFTDLDPGVWYHWVLEAELDDNRIDSVQLGRPGEWRRMHASSADWYLAGGATGSLPWPIGVSLSAGEAGASGSALAVDLLLDAVGHCYGDCDDDGVYTIFDFLCFQTRFAVGDRYADCDASGTIDYFDFLCFWDEYVYGCGP